MRGTNEIDLSGLHMLAELAHELQTFRNNAGEDMPVDITFGNVKHQVDERMRNAQLIHHMYGDEEEHQVPLPTFFLHPQNLGSPLM